MVFYLMSCNQVKDYLSLPAVQELSLNRFQLNSDQFYFSQQWDLDQIAQFVVQRDRNEAESQQNMDDEEEDYKWQYQPVMENQYQFSQYAADNLEQTNFEHLKNQKIQLKCSTKVNPDQLKTPARAAFKSTSRRTLQHSSPSLKNPSLSVKKKKERSKRLPKRDQNEIKEQSSTDPNWRKRPRPKQPMPAFTISFLIKAKFFFQKYQQNLSSGLINSQNSLRKFAIQNEYARSSIYYLYKKWLLDKDFRIMQQAIKNGIFNPNYRGRNKATNFRLDIVYRILDRNPLLHAKEVAQIVGKDPRCIRIDSEGNPITLNERIISRIYSYEKLRRIKLILVSTIRNNPEDVQRRKYYCQNLVNALQNKFKVFYLDEMIINRWINRTRVWGRTGQSFVNAMINLRRFSFLLVAIMNDKGIVKYQVIHGNSPAEKYQRVVQQLIYKAKQKEPSEKRLIVIHAAVGNQVKHLMKEEAEKEGFMTLILPPFSTQLSPLVSWFLEVRNLLRKHKFQNDLQLINATRSVLNEELRQKKLGNFVQGVERYVNKGLDSIIF